MHNAIETLAHEAGEIALQHFNRLASVAVEQKGHLDLVTAAGKHVERFLTDRLQELFPDDGILGEEGSAVIGTSDRIWVIDPIDGTFNFVRGGDQWAISIGIYEGREPAFGVLHAPVRGQTLKGGRTLAPSLNGKLLEPLSRSTARVPRLGWGFIQLFPPRSGSRF